MTEAEYNSLLVKDADVLETVLLRNNGFVATCAPAVISYTGFDNIFHIELSQNGIRQIIIKSEAPSKPIEFQTILNDVLRLLMVFDGSFLCLQQATFYFNGNECEWSNLFIEESRNRALSYFKSADFTQGAINSFSIPLSILTNNLFSQWISIENELDIVQPMVLYGMSNVQIPVDLKVSMLIESFESLFELIQKYHSDFQKAPEIKNPNSGKDSSLRRKLESIILKYGTDIFEQEIKKDVHLFCHVLVSSRNRIAHIKTNNKKLTLSGEESVLYAAKLSWLYRIIILDLLGVEYSYYSSNLKKNIERWNSWNGVLAFFLSTEWADS